MSLSSTKSSFIQKLAYFIVAVILATMIGYVPCWWPCGEIIWAVKVMLLAAIGTTLGLELNK